MKKHNQLKINQSTDNEISKMPEKFLIHFNIFIIKLRVLSVFKYFCSFDLLSVMSMGGWVGGSITLCSLNLSTKDCWVASFKPQLLYFQWYSSWLSLDMRMGGHQSQYWFCEEKSTFSYWDSNSDSSIMQPITQSLYQLSHPCSIFEFKMCEWHRLITLLDVVLVFFAILGSFTAAVHCQTQVACKKVIMIFFSTIAFYVLNK
jgi:hypothetical protein